MIPTFSHPFHRTSNASDSQRHRAHRDRYSKLSPFQRNQNTVSTEWRNVRGTSRGRLVSHNHRVSVVAQCCPSCFTRSSGRASIPARA